MPFNSDYFKAAFSVDNVIFGFSDGNLKVLLIKRGRPPFEGDWALPGALVYPDEDLDTSAFRVLKELTGLDKVYLEQVRTFGKTNRHPEGRVITVVYYSLVNIAKLNPTAASWANEIKWEEVNQIEELAFDHVDILQSCLKRLRQKVKTEPIGFELLPKKFTLSQLQSVYEAVLQKKLDKRNFRKKILHSHVVESLGEMQQNVSHRPAELYSFDEEKYNYAANNGYTFGI